MKKLLLSVGESPGFAIVKVAPFESYVGLPDAGTNESTEPLVKSTWIALPSAVSGGHAVLMSVEARYFGSYRNLLCVRGLHEV